MLSRPRTTAALLSLAFAATGALVAAPAHAATTTVTGVVTVADDPSADDAVLRVWAVQPGVNPGSPGAVSTVADAATGEFELDVVTEGDYHLYIEDTAQGSVYAPEWWQNERERADATLLSLEGDPVELSEPVVLDLLPLVSGTTPTITGAAEVGSRIRAVTTGWDPGLDYAYEWLADGAVISGQTADSLNLTSAHVGRRISVRVTGSIVGYRPLTLISAETAPVADTQEQVISGSQPFINGDAATGETLTVDAGPWSPAGVALTYRWLAGGVVRGTSSSLLLTDAMIGMTVQVEVTGSKVGMAPVTHLSAATSPVRGRTVTIAAATPTISGEARVGSPLTVTEGAWTPSTVTFAYQWFADGRAVQGATSRRFVPTDAQAGQRMSVDVTGSLAGSQSVTTNSAETEVVIGQVRGAKPKIRGKAVVGKKLKVVAGQWSPTAVRLSYVWLRNGKVIKGAKSSTYKLTRKDAGKRISVRVSGAATGFDAATMTSKATKKVKR